MHLRIHYFFSFTPSERSSGLGYFCGDDLFLIGGRTQNNLPNELVEHFKVDRSTFLELLIFFSKISNKPIYIYIYCTES